MLYFCFFCLCSFCYLHLLLHFSLHLIGDVSRLSLRLQSSPKPNQSTYIPKMPDAGDMYNATQLAQTAFPLVCAILGIIGIFLVLYSTRYEIAEKQTHLVSVSCRFDPQFHCYGIMLYKSSTRKIFNGRCGMSDGRFLCLFRSMRIHALINLLGDGEILLYHNAKGSD